jgi:hypothetical protein
VLVDGWRGLWSDATPSNRAHFSEQLAQAGRHEGSQLFDWLTEIIRDHGQGGRESDDNVHLELL